MSWQRTPFIPYPRSASHGVIGDRRTAALVSSDGTLDWLCTPGFDGRPVFGALLDAQRGGYCRFGPTSVHAGTQTYQGHSAVLHTTWSHGASELVLTDFMLGPGDARDPALGPCVVRRLRCSRGDVSCTYSCDPRGDLQSKRPPRALRTWTTANVSERFELHAGEQAWAVLDLGAGAGSWSIERARDELSRAQTFWERSVAQLHYAGKYADVVRHSAFVMRLLTYEPTGGVVAAATAALPERLGSSRNYDYRYCWVRDASLAIASFARLGDDTEATRFFDWLTRLETPRHKPLQVCYGVRGERDLAETKHHELHGYRGSRPVVFGNRAYKQRQLGSLGYLADSAWLHLTYGGSWKPEYDELIARCADYTCSNWERNDSGLWEMQKHAPFTMSKVMCWVTLDRALRITERTGGASAPARERWRRTADLVHADVLEHGWSARANAFRQRYGADALDAGLLLMPIVGFLPPDDRRVTATIDRIHQALMIDGFVYRFVPGDTPGEPDEAVGEFEASFLPCSFWLATAHALAGRVPEAEGVLERAIGVTNALGLFAEEYDPRTGDQLGNYPQLFTHAECVRAILEIDAAQQRGGRVAAPGT